ncbi:hypothetical protein ABT282_07445 [Streptomyces sp. NPDC000927]|uniref:hypothetical protein n=1 Tax=Streptomyces sp. NPDC000927 TaxID=3154371 RepID=UPI0033255816
MKARKAFIIEWPDDGTGYKPRWLEDCAKRAQEPIPQGAKRIPVKIMGSGRWECDGCQSGKH